MKSINENIFVVDSFGDLCVRQVSDAMSNKHMLIVVPGMIDDSDTEAQYANMATLALRMVSPSEPWSVCILTNQSHGYVSDALESAIGKLSGDLSKALFDECPEYPARLLRYILDRRPNSKKTAILCHSQGGILTTNAVNAANEYIAKDLEIIFFGAANWFLPRKVDRDRMTVITTRVDPVAILFGRALHPKTIRISKLINHSVHKYYPAMVLAMTHVLAETSIASFREDLRHV